MHKDLGTMLEEARYLLFRERKKADASASAPEVSISLEGRPQNDNFGSCQGVAESLGYAYMEPLAALGA